MFHRSTPFQITLSILTEDAKAADACRKYWEFDSKRSVFVNAADAVALALGQSRNNGLQLISSSCSATAVGPCSRCQERIEISVRNRSEFSQRVLRYILCEPCRQKHAAEHAQLMDFQNEFLERRQSEVERILDRPAASDRPAKQRGEGPTQTTARIEIEMGSVRRVVRFTRVSKHEVSLDTGCNATADQADSAQTIAKAKLTVEGEADLGTAASLENDSFGYFVTVSRDGSFSIHRARTEQILTTRSMVVLEENAGSGQSVRNELFSELYCAIQDDFMELPKAQWEEDDDGLKV